MSHVPRSITVQQPGSNKCRCWVGPSCHRSLLKASACESSRVSFLSKKKRQHNLWNYDTTWAKTTFPVAIPVFFVVFCFMLTRSKPKWLHHHRHHDTWPWEVVFLLHALSVAKCAALKGCYVVTPSHWGLIFNSHYSKSPKFSGLQRILKTCMVIFDSLLQQQQHLTLFRLDKGI